MIQCKTINYLLATFSSCASEVFTVENSFQVSHVNCSSGTEWNSLHPSSMQGQPFFVCESFYDKKTFDIKYAIPTLFEVIVWKFETIYCKVKLQDISAWSAWKEELTVTTRFTWICCLFAILFSE